jgi:hypothetical protein
MYFIWIYALQWKIYLKFIWIYALQWKIYLKFKDQYPKLAWKHGGGGGEGGGGTNNVYTCK